MTGDDRSAVRLRRVCRHVAPTACCAAAAQPPSAAGPAAEYQLVVLATADAADCLAIMPDLETWRTSIDDADTSWGYRVNRGGSALVACAFLYTAAAGANGGHCTVSNVMTNEDHRHRGLAKALMLELLRVADGRPTSLFASEMGAPLYEQLGFRTADSATGFRCEQECTLERAAAAASAAGVAVSIAAGPTVAEITEVSVLDSTMFGGNRVALLQSALGPGTDATLAVARDVSGEITAFAASSRPNIFSQGARQYGPVVAVTTPGALAVLAALMTADQAAAAEVAEADAERSPVLLTVRTSQRSFVRGLLELGFVEGDHPSPCMLANAEEFPGERDMYFAIHIAGSG